MLNAFGFFGPFKKQAHMNRLTIQEYISVPGQIESWINFLTSLKHEEFKPIKVSENRIVFEATTSIGVLMIKHNTRSGFPIKLFAEVADQNEKVSIKLFTKFRRDWYFLIGSSVLILLISILGYRTYEELFLGLILAFLVPVWFWGVHRWQERTLLKLVKEKIRKKTHLHNK